MATSAAHRDFARGVMKLSMLEYDPSTGQICNKVCTYNAFKQQFLWQTTHSREVLQAVLARLEELVQGGKAARLSKSAIKKLVTSAFEKARPRPPRNCLRHVCTQGLTRTFLLARSGCATVGEERAAVLPFHGACWVSRRTVQS